MMRAVICSYLRSGGYDPVAVDNAEAAIAMLDAAVQEGKPFAALTTDVEMPGTDGLTMIRRLRGRAEYTDLPIVVVSQHQEPQFRARALACGASAYVVKLDRVELQEVLTKMIPDTTRRAA